MSEQKHTPEPWHIDAVGNIWADTKICNMREIADRAESYRVMTESEHRANASRIVACVNACAGIDTVTLESLASTGNQTIKSAATNAERVGQLEQQRDQLLEALKVAMRFIDSHVADPDITAEMADAWIALQKTNPYFIIAAVEGGNKS